MKAISPKGTEIVGTSDKILATAQIQSGTFTRATDGRLDFDSVGYTEVLWDTQETLRRGDKRLFIDERGDEWAEDEITLVEENPEEADDA